MKRLDKIGLAALLAVIVVSAVAGISLAAGDVVAPVSTAVINIRGEEQLSQSGNYWWGDTLLLTDCVAYASTTTNTPQGLSNVTVRVVIGNSGSSVTYTGNVATAASGTWWLSAPMPASGSVYLQTTLIDENTNTFTYESKIFSMRTKLGD